MDSKEFLEELAQVSDDALRAHVSEDQDFFTKLQELSQSEPVVFNKFMDRLTNIPTVRDEIWYSISEDGHEASYSQSKKAIYQKLEPYLAEDIKLSEWAPSAVLLMLDQRHNESPQSRFAMLDNLIPPPSFTCLLNMPPRIFLIPLPSMASMIALKRQ